MSQTGGRPRWEARVCHALVSCMRAVCACSVDTWTNGWPLCASEWGRTVCDISSTDRETVRPVPAWKRSTHSSTSINAQWRHTTTTVHFPDYHWQYLMLWLAEDAVIHPLPPCLYHLWCWHASFCSDLFLFLRLLSFFQLLVLAFDERDQCVTPSLQLLKNKIPRNKRSENNHSQWWFILQNCSNINDSKHWNVLSQLFKYW